jgi:hypothetical protein
MGFVLLLKDVDEIGPGRAEARNSFRFLFIVSRSAPESCEREERKPSEILQKGKALWLKDLFSEAAPWA